MILHLLNPSWDLWPYFEMYLYSISINLQSQIPRRSSVIQNREKTVPGARISDQLADFIWYKLYHMTEFNVTEVLTPNQSGELQCHPSTSLAIQNLWEVLKMNGLHSFLNGGLSEKTDFEGKTDLISVHKCTYTLNKLLHTFNKVYS